MSPCVDGALNEKARHRDRERASVTASVSVVPITGTDENSVVAFLASDDAGHITMQDIVVDGGSALIA